MLPGPLAVRVIIGQKKVQRPFDLCTFNVALHASETGAAKPEWTLLWDLSVDARDVPIFGDQAWGMTVTSTASHIPQAGCRLASTGLHMGTRDGRR